MKILQDIKLFAINLTHYPETGYIMDTDAENTTEVEQQGVEVSGLPDSVGAVINGENNPHHRTERVIAEQLNGDSPLDEPEIPPAAAPETPTPPPHDNDEDTAEALTPPDEGTGPAVVDEFPAPEAPEQNDDENPA